MDRFFIISLLLFLFGAVGAPRIQCLPPSYRAQRVPTCLKYFNHICPPCLRTSAFATGKQVHGGLAMPRPGVNCDVRLRKQSEGCHSVAWNRLNKPSQKIGLRKLGGVFYSVGQ